MYTHFLLATRKIHSLMFPRIGSRCRSTQCQFIRSQSCLNTCAWSRSVPKCASSWSFPHFILGLGPRVRSTGPTLTLLVANIHYILCFRRHIVYWDSNRRPCDVLPMSSQSSLWLNISIVEIEDAPKTTDDLKTQFNGKTTYPSC